MVVVVEVWSEPRYLKLKFYTIEPYHKKEHTKTDVCYEKLLNWNDKFLKISQLQNYIYIYTVEPLINMQTPLGPSKCCMA